MNFVVRRCKLGARVMWPSVPEQLQLLDDRQRAILVMISLFVGEFGQTAGWRIRRCRAFNTVRVGVDTTSSGAAAGGWASLLAGINLLVTIIKMRALGMGMMKMPIFTWTALCTNMIVASFPVLTAVLAPAVHGPLSGHRRLLRTTLAATRCTST
jgi:cytochrome o ubiquinol oxidase subunit 1